MNRFDDRPPVEVGGFFQFGQNPSYYYVYEIRCSYDYDGEGRYNTYQLIAVCISNSTRLVGKRVMFPYNKYVSEYWSEDGSFKVLTMEEIKRLR